MKKAFLLFELLQQYKEDLVLYEEYNKIKWNFEDIY